MNKITKHVALNYKIDRSYSSNNNNNYYYNFNNNLYK